ncbi:HS12B-like protein, partial [Mya arenaria]
TDTQTDILTYRHTDRRTDGWTGLPDRDARLLLPCLDKSYQNKSFPVSFLPGRIHLHPPSAPSIEETSTRDAIFCDQRQAKDGKMQIYNTFIISPKEYTPAKDIQERIEMPAIDMFANAIGLIKQKLQEDLDKRDSGIRESDIHWVLTMPAIWNDFAKQFMRWNIGRNAFLALEPEAASVLCRDLFPCVGKVGTRYIIHDLGGDTADIMCHIRWWIKIVKRTGRYLSFDSGKNFKKKYLKEFWEMMADSEMSKREFDGNFKLIVKFPARLDEIHVYGDYERVDDVLQEAG